MDVAYLEQQKRIISKKIKHDYSKKMLDKQLAKIDSNSNLSEMEKIIYMGNIDSTFLKDVEKLKEDLRKIQNQIERYKTIRRGGRERKQRKTQKRKI